MANLTYYNFISIYTYSLVRLLMQITLMPSYLHVSLMYILNIFFNVSYLHNLHDDYSDDCCMHFNSNKNILQNIFFLKPTFADKWDF